MTRNEIDALPANVRNLIDGLTGTIRKMARKMIEQRKRARRTVTTQDVRTLFAVLSCAMIGAPEILPQINDEIYARLKRLNVL